MTANEKYVSGAEKELDEFCDNYFGKMTRKWKIIVPRHIPTNPE
jgi:hypothetical protein